MSIKEQMTAFILEYFGFEATSEQQKAAKMISSFIFERDEKSLFLLKGYAGTGKTSLVGAVVQALDALKQRTVLMAPTGRAAKVFSRHATHPAITNHKRIYPQKSF